MGRNSSVMRSVAAGHGASLPLVFVRAAFSDLIVDLIVSPLPPPAQAAGSTISFPRIMFIPQVKVNSPGSSGVNSMGVVW